MQCSQVSVPHEQEPDTPLCERFLVADASCAVATNSEEILSAAHGFLRQSINSSLAPDLRLFLWTDAKARGGPPWPQPYFRGLGHLVYVGLDRECSLLLDLRRRRAIGRFSPAMAQDVGYWQRVIFPNALGLMSEALGLTTLHCACVERDGAGLLLAGGSGAGKSTLALALARNGFAFVSDDWTYFCEAGEQLRAWGLGRSVKLLPDAVEHFPELAGFAPAISPNGELAYEVDPERVFGVARAFTCEPRWLMFLERRGVARCTVTRMAPQEAVARLEVDLEDLPEELSPLREAQSKTILELAGRECWLLRHGQNPGEMAQMLALFCSNQPSPAPRAARRSDGISHSVRKGPDIIKRFTPTPLVADLEARGRAIRLETNNTTLLQKVCDAVGGPSPSPAAGPPFLWRLVSEAGGGLHAPWPAPSCLVADGLHLENVGQHDFFAVDAEARVAVSFVGEELVNDPGFAEFFISRLVSATSVALETTR